MFKLNRLPFGNRLINQSIQRRTLSMISSPFGITRNSMVNNPHEFSRTQTNVGSSIIGHPFGQFSPSLLINGLQRRWKSRGNTYQPSTLKRKRKFGFLARMMNKRTSKIIKRRKEKGRWYLSH